MKLPAQRDTGALFIQILTECLFLSRFINTNIIVLLQQEGILTFLTISLSAKANYH